MEVGRICVKIVGREAGKKCVLVDIVDKNFVLITGPKAVSDIKRRRANINHIEPTSEKIDINRGATDEEITEALKTAGKLEEMAKTVKPAIS
jgi:large subunit ribosomal protein L14e